MGGELMLSAIGFFLIILFLGMPVAFAIAISDVYKRQYGGSDVGDGGMQRYAGDGKYPDHSGG